MLVPKKERREAPDLPLTAMIDVFSMIVIFLIMGTVFGAADISVSTGLTLPQSASKESVESAPRVTINGDRVETSFLNETRDLRFFEPASADAPELADYKAKLKGYVGKLTGAARSSGVLINVVADRGTPYRRVFDVIRVFREAGFESLLFVASGAASGGSTPIPGISQ